MVTRKAKPLKRDGSSIEHFIKRIPADIKSLLIGKSIPIPIGGQTILYKVTKSTQSLRLSLRSKDPREAAIRHLEVAAYLEGYFENLRSKRPIQLSHRQVTAIAGEFYKLWARGPDEEITTPLHYSVEPDGSRKLWDHDHDERDDAEMALAVEKALRDRAAGLEPGQPGATFTPDIKAGLALHGIAEVTDATMRQLDKAFMQMYLDARSQHARVFAGDYSPDAKREGLPVWGPTDNVGASVPLTELVDGWWVEAKAAGRTEGTKRNTTYVFRMLTSFLGHDNALRVTADDIVRYKDHRLATVNPRMDRPMTPQSFKTSDLGALNSVFRWAVANRKLPSNPAEGLTVKVGRRVKLRERDFRPEEIAAILNKSLSEPIPVAKYKTQQIALCKRWAPWLCAYSGARIGEIIQLRKEDIRKVGQSWVINITPEAGTVKSKEYREVPIHPHLIELGFMRFVEGAPEGYLFLTIKKGATFMETARAMSDRLRRYVREVVTDPNVAPNHGWRHTFKSRGFEAGIQEKVLDALCGHAPTSIARSYGSVSLKTRIDAILQFPRYEIGNKTDGQAAE